MSSVTKRILFNGRYLTQKITGVQRYAIETMAAICKLLPAGAAAIAIPTKHSACFKQFFSGQLSVCLYTGTSRLIGHFWEQFSLPFSRDKVLVNFCNTYPILKKRQVVVVHDASVYAFPDGYKKAFVIYYKFLFWLLRFKKSIRIVTDSEFSKKELTSRAGIPSERVSVVYCGADHWNDVVPNVSILEKHNLLRRRYLLAVASANPNKNINRLLHAYQQLARCEIALVLVGGTNRRVFSSDGHSGNDGVILTGYVSDEELAALYGNAIGFVFPSLYEGFGLPPLEAMIFDCPVISSREASLPEVCGEAALYCDAYDFNDIASAMRRLIDDESLRAELVSAGKLQVEKFKWQNTAKAILDIAMEIK